MKRNKLALLLAATLLTITSSAYALIDRGYSAVYYSDATYTTAVGEGGITCIRNNKWMAWGVSTPYYIVYERQSCCGTECVEGPFFN
jgi:hypothetical protein